MVYKYYKKKKKKKSFKKKLQNFGFQGFLLRSF